MMKWIIGGAVLLAGTMVLATGNGNENGQGHGREMVYEITFTNITHHVILTPPIIALSDQSVEIFRVGEPGSLGLAMLAEGGETDELRAELEAKGVSNIVQTSEPVMPGQSIMVEMVGDSRSRLNLASMLLPTNDGFVAVNGRRVFDRSGKTMFRLGSHDAGTEMNDELCASIPGPQCGGEGFNEEGGEGNVVPHPGIHGEGELSRRMYSWGEPVALVTVRAVR